MGCRPGPPRSGRRAESLRDRVAQPLELPAPHLFQVGAVGPRRRRLVEEDRHAEAPPDLQPRLAGQQHALLQLDAGDGHKGNHVRRADARVNSLLAGQVDQLGRLACAAHRRLHHRRRDRRRSVTTERLWSASIDQSSRCTPSTRIAATMASTRRASVPSEKFGTHSTTARSCFSDLHARPFAGSSHFQKV